MRNTDEMAMYTQDFLNAINQSKNKSEYICNILQEYAPNYINNINTTNAFEKIYQALDYAKDNNLPIKAHNVEQIFQTITAQLEQTTKKGTKLTEKQLLGIIKLGQNLCAATPLDKEKSASIMKGLAVAAAQNSAVPTKQEQTLTQQMSETITLKDFQNYKKQTTPDYLTRKGPVGMFFSKVWAAITFNKETKSQIAKLEKLDKIEQEIKKTGTTLYNWEKDVKTHSISVEILNHKNPQRKKITNSRYTGQFTSQTTPTKAQNRDTFRQFNER